MIEFFEYVIDEAEQRGVPPCVIFEEELAAYRWLQANPVTRTENSDERLST